ncbi:MAG: DHA2 family efflux MFS transporter permease subunit [Labilithrix sp.]|nr:DHA2 family efflux MFS transporter permease subunit [Labilithrix sp.]
MSTNHARSGAGRTIALAVLCTGALMAVLDGSIVNVALPPLQRELGFSAGGLAWVLNAYLIGLGGFLLLAGRLGDLVGRRRIYVAGLAVFTAATMFAGLTGDKDILVAARFIQGIGGAMMTSVILGMIVAIHPEPGDRAKAIGVYSFVQAIGGTVGLVGGGFLADAVGPRAVFFVNVPFGIAAAIASLRVLPRDRPQASHGGADVAGALLVMSTTMLAVYTIIASGELGWTSPRVTGLLAIVSVLFVAFVVRQATAAHPLVALGVFRSRDLTGGNLVFGAMVGAMFGFQFLGALFLQRVLGYGATKTGLALAPVAIAIAALSLGLSARLLTRFGARTVLVPSLSLLAAGLAWLARMPATATYAESVLPVTLLLGAGAGLAIPTTMTLAMSGVAPRDAGLASGLLNTTQQIAGALGLTGLGAIAAARTDRLAAAGAADALAGGYRAAFAAGAALVVVAIAIAATLFRPRKKGPA